MADWEGVSVFTDHMKHYSFSKLCVILIYLVNNETWGPGVRADGAET